MGTTDAVMEKVDGPDFERHRMLSTSSVHSLHSGDGECIGLFGQMKLLDDT